MTIRFRRKVPLSLFAEERARCAASDRNLVHLGPAPDSDIRVERFSWPGVRAKGSRAKQAALAHLPDGEYIRWVSDGRVLPVGGSAMDFAVISSYRPGFTTAYVSEGRYLSYPGAGPPPGVTEQLIPLLKPEVNSRITLTLGPRFPPSATRQAITSDYRIVLQELSTRQAPADFSSFCRRIVSILDARATPEIRTCLEDKLSRLAHGHEAGRERDIASELLLALQ